MYSPVILPVRSNAARPFVIVSENPLIALLSSPTTFAGASNRTHFPVGGKLPIRRRLAVPSFPQAVMRLAPQYALWSQSLWLGPAFHCSMISLGGLAGSRKT